MFLPIGLILALCFGTGFVAAKGNVTSAIVQSIQGVATPASAPAAK